MLYIYKIPRDYGFAPNPYFNYCTLATCKPNIRGRASKDDWIAGFTTNRKGEICRLVYLMQVTESLTFDEYWNDERFQQKKPVFTKSLKECYGDNIYHHSQDGTWMQENSHHSNEDGSINSKNLRTDIQTDRVLISEEYWYFGCNSIELPNEFAEIIPTWRNYKLFDETNEKRLLEYIGGKYTRGVYGRPLKWVNGNFERYKGV